MAQKAKKKVKKKKKLSRDEKLQRKIKISHRNAVRSIFKNTGFVRVPGVSDKEFSYGGQTGDFDDVFIFENIVVLCEYTMTKSGNIGDHLKPKKILFDKILSDKASFLDFFRNEFQPFREAISKSYHKTQMPVILAYCPLNEMAAKYKANVPGPVYFEYPAVKYFKSLTDAIKISARQELFEFLGISQSDIGKHSTMSVPAGGSSKIRGTLLPEADSHFPEGYKVATFYMSPEDVLRRAYVLRKDGWKDSFSLYQRMISKGKIDLIRKYLRSKKRVFVNNLVATLPEDTKLLNEDGSILDPSKVTATCPIQIEIPDEINSMGLIDGQHRAFAYHETVNDDEYFRILRRQQNLLVTGIIYPEGVSKLGREKFEAQLFLEINSTQTNAKSNLKQAIGLILDPFSSESIATRVMNVLSTGTGPLGGYIERHFYDQDKLKSTSIVSYGLKPLVKTSGEDSLFSLWNNEKKDEMIEKQSEELLGEYVTFCAQKINEFFNAVYKNVDGNLWTADRAVFNRLLTTVNVNAFLICLRRIIENKKASSAQVYKGKLAGIGQFKFNNFHSSQYNKMADRIFKNFFI